MYVWVLGLVALVMGAMSYFGEKKVRLGMFLIGVGVGIAIVMVVEFSTMFYG